MIGARVGEAGIPSEWLDNLKDWPRTRAWLRRLADHAVTAVDSGMPGPFPRLPLYGLLPRNALFLTVVLLHGFRRLLPPY
jgi:hypothetical protein